jgi:hypothetical protein
VYDDEESYLIEAKHAAREAKVVRSGMNSKKESVENTRKATQSKMMIDQISYQGILTLLLS